MTKTSETSSSMNMSITEFVKHLLLIIACLAGCCVAARAQSEQNDSVKTRILDEVEVTVDAEIHKEGYDILTLSKYNRNFGTNALDAVSSLNRFRTTLNATSLTTFDNSAVFILINGVPATAMELRAYKGSDIKNVEFYSVAPPKYMTFTTGPVANIVLKKRYDRLFSGYFNLSNSVNTGFGTDQASLIYRDSLNQVKVDYFVDYRNLHPITVRKRYDYSPETHSEYNERQRYVGAMHTATAAYQLYKTHHLLSAKLAYTANPRKESATGERYHNAYGESSSSTSGSLLKSNSNSVALDLYYNYISKKGNLLALNVVNTLGKSSSESALWNAEAKAAPAAADNRVESLTKNESYSLTANTVYGLYIRRTWVSFSGRYRYHELSQRFGDSRFKPLSHEGTFNAGMMWRKNAFSIVPNVGLQLLGQRDAVASSTDLLPYARIYADWWPGGKIKGFTVQLTLSMNNMAPPLSLLTAASSYIDYSFISKGNPDLDKYTQYRGKLSVAYYAPDGKNMVAFALNSYYSHHPIASVITKDGATPVLQPTNLRYSFKNSAYLNATWYPVGWLEISPYTELYTFKHNTPSQRIRDVYFRYGGSVAATYRNCTFLLAANSPTKEYDGDLCEYGSPQFAAVVEYKYRNWSIGAEWHFSGKDEYTKSDSPLFRYKVTKDWKPLHNLIQITASYSFSIGKARRHSNKYINESIDGDDLNKYNKPETP